MNTDNDSILKRLELFFSKLFAFRQTSLDESVSELIKEHEENAPDNTEEREMLKNLLAFKTLKASEVMVPRTDIKGVEIGISATELRQTFIETGHTRLPVFKENLDQIVGFVHVKDFFSALGVEEKEIKIENLIRQLIYAPRSMKLISLLQKMRANGVHIAIVLDEYGGTDGLLTIEDLVEEIVGEIRDEHDDDEEKNLIKEIDNYLLVDGRASISSIEEKLEKSLSNEHGEYETFGGFILSFLGHIPETGEKFSHPSGINIEIVKADQRKIELAKVFPLKNTTAID
jgi:CBS domain containing-hemolysin-like protein